MEISISAIAGALFAIIILCVLVHAIVTVLRQNGVAINPSIVTIVWALVTILCIVILAWGLGINIPFFRW